MEVIPLSKHKEINTFSIEGGVNLVAGREVCPATFMQIY
ncbi:MAG: hypothetical protein DDT31_00383 [Syntrophomonadaceae bacterium]|nr:hypothetical protein [Bacillota bacterium]